MKLKTEKIAKSLVVAIVLFGVIFFNVILFQLLTEKVWASPITFFSMLVIFALTFSFAFTRGMMWVFNLKKCKVDMYYNR